MSYKIVKTIEDDEILFAVVPSAWEQNNLLYWPPTINIKKYVNNVNSKPGPNWTTQSCEVKKRNIPNLLEARKLEKMLTVFADIEFEESNTTFEEINREPSQNPLQIDKQTVNNYKQAQQTFDDTSTRCITPNLMYTSSDIDMLERNPPILKFEIGSENDEGINNSESGRSPQQDVDINSKLDNIYKEINRLHRKMDKIIQVLSKSNHVSTSREQHDDLETFASKLNHENYNKHLQRIRAQNRNRRSFEEATSNEEINFSNFQDPSFPLNTEKDLELLENRLFDENYRNALIDQMSLFGGTTGKKNGNKIAYKVVDAFVTRELFSLYSWTGCSRSGAKKCFQKYSEIISVFFDIIHLADRNFSKEDNEIFFRKVLKHSFTRMNRCVKRCKIEVPESVVSQPELSLL